MFLIDEEIRLMGKMGFLKPYDAKNVSTVSYTLTIKSFPQNIGHELVRLGPKESIVAECIESVFMPDRIITIIAPRPELPRDGISILPVAYQPGDKSRIFILITNTGNSPVFVGVGDRPATAMFYKLSDVPLIESDLNDLHERAI